MRAMQQSLQDPSCPATLCTVAATNIAKLTRDYSLFYKMRQIPSPAVHCIFIAATIHLLNHHMLKDEHHQFLFQGCLSALSEISESYPIGERAVSVLQSLSAQFDQRVSTNQNWKLHKPTSLYASGRNSPQHNGSRGGHSKDTESRGLDQPNDTNIIYSSANDIGPFDWSVYNSPIELPSADNNFTAVAAGQPWADMTGMAYFNPSASYFDLSDQGLAVPSRYTGDFSDGQENPPFMTPADTEFFERHYGTAFGLV
jgi:hypothetical protein